MHVECNTAARSCDHYWMEKPFVLLAYMWMLTEYNCLVLPWARKKWSLSIPVDIQKISHYCTCRSCPVLTKFRISQISRISVRSELCWYMPTNRRTNMTNYNRGFCFISEGAQVSPGRMAGIRAVICNEDLLNILVDIGQNNKTIDCGTRRVVTIAFQMKART